MLTLWSYVSPRHRAQRTLELLDLGCHAKLPWADATETQRDFKVTDKTIVQVTEDIREWDYGDYEGLTSPTIRKQRSEKGEGPWDIWKDGCPGGESPAEITKRLDEVIADIRRRYHGPALDGKTDKGDVLLVAHGHILRAFAVRWIGRELTQGVALLLEAGGVGTLSYEHGKIDEPAIMLGGAFMADDVGNAEK